MYEIIITLLLFLLLILKKYVFKNFFNPVFIMTFYWSFFIVAAFVSFNNIDWKFLGLLWIIIACVFFGLGFIISYFIFNKTKVNSYNNQIGQSIYRVSNISWLFIIVCIILGLTRTFLEIIINGFTLSMVFDINTLIDINTTFAYQRYFEGGPSYNQYMQFLLVFIYAAPLCGGYAYNYIQKKSQRIICLSTFLPIMSSLLLTNSKAGLLACVFLWTSGFIVGYLEKHKKSPEIKFKKIINITIFGLLIFGLLYLSMMFRVGDLSAQTHNIVLEKYKLYAFGHVPAFDYWFANNGNQPGYTLGQYTFIAFFDLLGIVNQKQGIYNDIVYVSLNYGTNVFTAFRGLISDFGVIGGLVFIMLLGIISGYAYYTLLKSRKREILPKLILSMVYFFVFYSFIVSIFSYLSYIIAFFIFVIYLKISKVEIKTSKF